jgi:hypothetical protein
MALAAPAQISPSSLPKFTPPGPLSLPLRSAGANGYVEWIGEGRGIVINADFNH